MWKTASKEFEVIWSAPAYRITSDFLQAAFYKFYLVYSWILCPIYFVGVLDTRLFTLQNDCLNSKMWQLWLLIEKFQYRPWDHSFSTYAKLSKKLIFQGVGNASFPENFAYVLSEWSPFKISLHDSIYVFDQKTDRR